MRIPLFVFAILPTLVLSEVPGIDGSESPDKKLHAVLDIDRDPSIDPEWKEGSYPRIEISEKGTGRVLASVDYFGSASDAVPPLRNNVRIAWRNDSKAFTICIADRYYSYCKVFLETRNGGFVEVKLPGYKEISGFDPPATEDLLPRGRETVLEWTSDGLLTYEIFLAPGPSYKGDDPLRHRALLAISSKGAKKVRSVKPDESE